MPIVPENIEKRREEKRGRTREVITEKSEK